MIQRMFKALVRRRRLKRAVEARKKMAIMIQGWFRGVIVRRVTRYGVGYDEQLAKAVKAKLEQHVLKPEPYNYQKIPAFEDLKYRKFVSKMPITVDGEQGEYYG